MYSASATATTPFAATFASIAHNYNLPPHCANALLSRAHFNGGVDAAICAKYTPPYPLYSSDSSSVTDSSSASASSSACDRQLCQQRIQPPVRSTYLGCGWWSLIDSGEGSEDTMEHFMSSFFINQQCCAVGILLPLTIWVKRGIKQDGAPQAATDMFTPLAITSKATITRSFSVQKSMNAPTQSHREWIPISRAILGYFL